MIRHYRPADLDDLLNAWTSASAIAHPFLSPEFLEQERHNIPNLYIPNADTWVWEVDGRVVGFMALLGNEVGGLFVDPKHQRDGIGHVFLDRARDIHGTLEVEVFRANSIGRAFYAKYGFELMNETVHEPTGLEVLRLIAH